MKKKLLYGFIFTGIITTTLLCMISDITHSLIFFEKDLRKLDPGETILDDIKTIIQGITKTVFEEKPINIHSDLQTIFDITSENQTILGKKRIKEIIISLNATNTLLQTFYKIKQKSQWPKHVQEYEELINNTIQQLTQLQQIKTKEPEIKITLSSDTSNQQKFIDFNTTYKNYVVSTLGSLVQVKVFQQFSSDPNKGVDASCGYQALKNTIYLLKAIFENTEKNLQALQDPKIATTLYGKLEDSQKILNQSAVGVWRKMIVTEMVRGIIGTFLKSFIFDLDKMLIKKNNENWDQCLRLTHETSKNDCFLYKFYLDILSQYRIDWLKEHLDTFFATNSPITIKLTRNDVINILQNQTKAKNSIENAPLTLSFKQEAKNIKTIENFINPNFNEISYTLNPSELHNLHQQFASLRENKLNELYAPLYISKKSAIQAWRQKNPTRDVTDKYILSIVAEEDYQRVQNQVPAPIDLSGDWINEGHITTLKNYENNNLLKDYQDIKIFVLQTFSLQEINDVQEYYKTSLHNKNSYICAFIIGGMPTIQHWDCMVANVVNNKRQYIIADSLPANRLYDNDSASEFLRSRFFILKDILEGKFVEIEEEIDPEVQLALQQFEAMNQ